MGVEMGPERGKDTIIYKRVVTLEGGCPPPDGGHSAASSEPRWAREIWSVTKYK